MRLFTKYTRVNLLATIVIFLFASAAFYFVLHYILLGQVDEDLKIEQHEIETFVKEHGGLPEPIPAKDQQINYTVTHKQLTGRKFSTVRSFDSSSEEKNAERVLLFTIDAGQKLYAVTVTKSLERTDDLMKSILLITFLTILLILAASITINRILLKRLWKPFYDSLNRVQTFRLDKPQSMNFDSGGIDEFDFMNSTLEKTTSQARKDYVLLKEFTENASHEMQTPLAIIRSKLDLFIQHENLSEDQSTTMQGAYQAVEKLARLNQSLLLLAKIENNQYTEISAVNLRQKLEEKTAAFRELWQNQGISVSTTLANVVVNMNPELADILLNNLLSNATRHNFVGGSIKIELRENELKVSNTSLQGELDKDRLFRRFYKQKTEAGHGLGLSIVKQICDISAFETDYSFCEGHHVFTVSWK